MMDKNYIFQLMLTPETKGHKTVKNDMDVLLVPPTLSVYIVEMVESERTKVNTRLRENKCLFTS